jgi:YVTN family beta-propeller protein
VDGRRPPFRRQTKISPRVVAFAGAALVAGSLVAGVLYTALGPSENVSVAPNSVIALDPRTNGLSADLAAGVHPQAVAVRDGSVWVANTDDHTVSRFDASTLELVRTIPVAVYPSDIAVGLGGVWVVSGPLGQLVRIDPKHERAGPPTALGYACRGRKASVTIGAGSVWAACDRVTGSFRIDPRTRRPTSFAFAAGFEAPRRHFSDAAFGFGMLWLADRARNEVIAVDPATNRAVRRVRVGRGPSALAIGAGSVWVANSGDGSVSRIVPVHAARRIDVGKDPVAVAAGENAVWVANAGDASLSRIDPRTNRVVTTVELSNTPVGLAVGAGRVWATVQSK